MKQKSPKEIQLENKLKEMLTGKALEAAEVLITDPEIHYLQEYSNTVSITRLGYNDHGPVHMRTVAINAMKMISLLTEAGIMLNLENEGSGTVDDSRTAVLLAAFLHDIGMSVGRAGHEEMAAILAQPVLERVLQKIYPEDMERQVITRTLATEGIVGHMASREIHSLEAGIILIADGCDMEKGRARIPMLLSRGSRPGDIHKYSASAINRVIISKGDELPIKITIKMSASVGFFQVEEVLLKKVYSSPVKPYIELFAGVEGRDLKRYL
ncbi:MAG: HD domain-containing protein [Spirochaetia bacterium]